MTYLFAVVAAYLLGSIPVRPWFGKVRKGLIRTPAAEKELGFWLWKWPKGSLPPYRPGFYWQVGPELPWPPWRLFSGKSFPSVRRAGGASGAGHGGGSPFRPQSALDLHRRAHLFSQSADYPLSPFSILCAAIGVLLFGLILSVHLYVWLVIFCLVGFDPSPAGEREKPLFFRQKSL